ncbi:males-absent on the first protein [Podospora conica]|nr:males-absent on the first protein [Schizothecium conicum]
MAPVKRKQQQHQSDTDPTNPSLSAKAADTVPRRATRSVAPLVEQEELEPPSKRRRLRRGLPPAAMATPATRLAQLPRGKENMPMEHPHGAIKATRLTRHSGPNNTVVVDSHRSSLLLPPVPVTTVSEPRPTRDPAKPRQQHGRSGATSQTQPPQQHTFQLGRNAPITMTASSAQPQHPPAPSPISGSGDQNGLVKPGDQQQSDRNIDKVVLGNIIFRAWYPSYYGKEVLGEDHHHTKGGKARRASPEDDISPSSSGGGSNDDVDGAKAHGRRERDNHPILERLYVCPHCFKYSKELVSWWGHVQFCERRGFIPGNKIYTHPKGRRVIHVPSEHPDKQKPRRGKCSAPKQQQEVVVQDKGEWSIWEVDGEKDVLFCQNLSLFAKLFLDNKSVFFDVTGFNYFLLVYTPPAPPPPTDLTNGEVADLPPPRGQVVGFFSKEKMSWDNNNLACILVFPPWQRKGLGALLMGVSYEISRREGLLGGPEKPISDLGKKGYKRFWAGEIARWLISLPANDEGAEDECVVDVAECSRATWIAPEDCLLVLREMGVVEEAASGPPLAKKRRVSPEEDRAGSPEVGEVERVKIVQREVLSWVTGNGISLERTCDPNGFVEGYAINNEVPPEEEEA